MSFNSDPLLSENQALRARIAELESQLQQYQHHEHSPFNRLLKHSIFEYNHSVMFLIDPVSGAIIDANHAAATFYGYDYHEFLQKNIRDISVKMSGDFNQAISMVISKKHTTSKSKHRLADGSLRFVDISAVYIDLDSKGFIFFIVHDITHEEEAHNALRENEALFRQMAEGVHEVFWMFDIQQQKMLYISPAYEQIWGRSRSSLYQDKLSFLTVIDPEDLPIMHQALHDQDQGLPTDIIYRIYRPDGSIRWIWDRSAPVLIDGQLARIAGVATDITKQRHIEAQLQAEEALRASEMQYRALVENSLQGVLVYQDGRIKFANRAISTLCGYSIEEILAFSTEQLGALFHPEDQYVLFAPRELTEAEPEIYSTLQFRIIHRDGSVHWAIAASRYILHQGSPAIQSMVVDISALKEAEAALLQSRDQLSRTNIELAQALRLKDQFLANMSHELRTPLNSVLGFSESLQEGVYGPISEGQRRAIQSITNSGNHLLSMINDILDLSRIEAGQMEISITNININDCCHDLLNSIKKSAQEQKLLVSLSIDPQATILASDERYLRQILHNLLSNAVKFTKKGGRIGLDVQLDARHQTIGFSVWDTGIGIAAEDLSLLFKPFIQIDAGLARRYEGTGLGLALVARLAELLHGSVTVESTLGQGSCFIVTLPWNGVLIEAVHNETAVSAISSSGHIIMIVDDNEANASIIAEYLEAHGYQAIVVLSGKEAIHRAEQLHPQLILMDIQMPEVNGLEAIQQIRMLPEMTHTPIIAVTALAMPGDRERCLAAGADEYISKPLSLRNLLARIQLFLGQGS